MHTTEKIVDVVFRIRDERELKLDIIKPVNSQDKFPCIIYVHGGGWMSGDKGNVGGDWNASFAEHGFVCININYRLSGEAIFPAALLDVKEAIRWVKSQASQYNIDENRIGIWGHSSGGHLAALAALSADHPDFDSKWNWVSDGVNAVVTISGPVDLLSMGAWHDNPNSPESKFLGGSVQQHVQRAKQASPINYISEKTPPVFIIHGDLDGICPVQQSQLLHQKLPYSSYLEIKGADHDLIGGLLTIDEILIFVRTFFTRVLVTGLISQTDLQKHRQEMDRAIQWFEKVSK